MNNKDQNVDIMVDEITKSKLRQSLVERIQDKDELNMIMDISDSDSIHSKEIYIPSTFKILRNNKK